MGSNKHINSLLLKPRHIQTKFISPPKPKILLNNQPKHSNLMDIIHSSNNSIIHHSNNLNNQFNSHSNSIKLPLMDNNHITEYLNLQTKVSPNKWDKVFHNNLSLKCNKWTLLYRTKFRTRFPTKYLKWPNNYHSRCSSFLHKYLYLCNRSSKRLDHLSSSKTIMVINNLKLNNNSSHNNNLLPTSCNSRAQLTMRCSGLDLWLGVKLID